MDNTKIRQELWESLDMAVLRWNLIITTGIDVFILAMIAISAGGIRTEEFQNVATLLCAITIIPMLIYSIRITVKIFRSPERYVFGRCILTQPHHCKLSRGTMYFTIVFENPDGRKEELTTRPIFASYGIAGPLLEDYINKTVDVAYNKETGSVVVIG